MIPIEVAFCIMCFMTGFAIRVIGKKTGLIGAAVTMWLASVSLFTIGGVILK